MAACWAVASARTRALVRFVAVAALACRWPSLRSACFGAALAVRLRVARNGSVTGGFGGAGSGLRVWVYAEWGGVRVMGGVVVLREAGASPGVWWVGVSVLQGTTPEGPEAPPGQR